MFYIFLFIFLSAIIAIISVILSILNGDKSIKTSASLLEPVGSRDAFGRERISEPFTLGDYKLIYGDTSEFLQNTTGTGGTLTNLTDKAAVRLSVTAGQGGSIVHQTKKYHYYMPGKSHLIYASFVMYDPSPGVTKRIGYFDDNDGIFVQQDGDGTLSLNIRDADSELRQFKSDVWDKSFDLDLNKTQLLFFDFQWLGVGRVRFGFVSGDEYIVYHTVYNSNNLAEVYMSTPNLPIRFEISGSSNNNGGYMDQICATVISEGGYNEAGKEWSYGTTAAKTLTSGSTDAILAIKLTDTFGGYNNRMTVTDKDLDVLSTADNVYFRLIKVSDSTTISSNWTDVNTGESGVMYSDGADVSYTSGGLVLKSGYVNGGDKHGPTGGSSEEGPSVTKQNYITQNYDSTNSECYVLVATNIGTASTNVFGSMSWKEIY